MTDSSYRTESEPSVISIMRSDGVTSVIAIYVKMTMIRMSERFFIMQ